MVHLLPLPGSPGWSGSMAQVLERALQDARYLCTGGVDAICVENFGDTPFLPCHVAPATVAAIALAVQRVRQEVDIPVGVNVLRNDASAALGICAATGASFIRVNVHTGAMLTDQGWITGAAHDTLRTRSQLDLDVAILADVFVKHATPPAGLTIEEAARDTWERGHADALIVTGSGTGEPADASAVERVRASVPEAPILVGSGVDASNAAHLLRHADGAIVGSAFKVDGRASSPVAPERVQEFMKVVAGIHS